MLRTRAASSVPVAIALVAGGAAFFVGSASSAAHGVRTPALVAIAVVTLVYLVRTVEPGWLISAGIAGSMFSGNWGQFGVPSGFPPDRILLVAGVIGVIIRERRAHRVFQPRPVHFALAAALTYAVISAIAAHALSNHEALFALIDQFGAMPFILFAVAPLAFRTNHQRRILLGSLVATGAYLSLTALFEKLQLTALVFPKYINNPAVGIHWGRARGPFVEAVANGLALYACAVAAIIAFATWRDRRWRAVAAAVAVLSVVALEMTVTRAVWLGAAIATVLMLVTAPQLRRFLIPAAVVAACIVVGAFAVIPGLATQASNRQNDQSPIWERQNADAAAFRMIAARPLIGFGWWGHDDTAQRIPYFRLNPSIPMAGENVSLHNLFLAYGVDLGVVGFGLWLAAAAFAFGGAARRRAPPDVEPWRLGLGAIVACYITAGIAGPLAYTYPTLLAWTWAGVASQREETDGATTMSLDHGKLRSTSLG